MHISPYEYILIISTVLEINPLFQTIKSIKTQNVKGLSLWTFLSIVVIGSLWLYYGIQIQSLPLIIGNAIKLLTSLTVVIIYFKFKKQ